MDISRFGQKLSREAGIVTLMDDLGNALRVNPDILFMGGGNPAHIPQVEDALEAALQRQLADPTRRRQLLGVYQSPQGEPELLDQLAALLRREYDWPVTRANIALANGSQSAFFVLFNLFAGEFADGSRRRIQLPLVPEYLGYSDLGISEDFFSASRPTIELLDNGFFKYRVDFSALQVTEQTGALCLSRPTNPTGNLVTDDELAQLDALTRGQGVPLIVDAAYGEPFPGIVFEKIRPHWNHNTILVLSLSKLGLPGARTGILVANPEVIDTFARASTVLSLASGNFGPAIALELLRSGELMSLSRQYVAPFYRQRRDQAVAVLQRELAGLPCRIHQPEGAFFLWLWFPELPITSEEFYQRLKSRGVLVVSGHHFFPGLDEDWPHRHQCLRITYCQDPAVVARGATIIAEELRAL